MKAFREGSLFSNNVYVNRNKKLKIGLADKTGIVRLGQKKLLLYSFFLCL